MALLSQSKSLAWQATLSSGIQCVTFSSAKAQAQTAQSPLLSVLLLGDYFIFSTLHLLFPCWSPHPLCSVPAEVHLVATAHHLNPTSTATLSRASQILIHIPSTSDSLTDFPQELPEFRGQLQFSPTASTAPSKMHASETVTRTRTFTKQKACTQTRHIHVLISHSLPALQETLPSTHKCDWPNFLE